MRLIAAGPAADLAALRPRPASPPVSDELMAYSLYGAIEQVAMRAAWDDQYDQRDIMLTHVFLFLAVEAAYRCQGDVTGRLDDYRASSTGSWSEGPPVPPDAAP